MNEKRFGRQIKLHLKEGIVTGLRKAEISNQTISALALPKNKLSELKEDAEANSPGIYFLFGDDENSEKQKVNIGEAENVYERLKYKITKDEYDFCNEIIFFVSKDENLTKAHVKYLESIAIENSRKIGRYTVFNENDSKKPSLPEPDIDVMKEFFINIKLLLGVLGHKVLEEYIPKAELVIAGGGKLAEKQPQLDNAVLQLYMNKEEVQASASQTDEGVVVLKGSEAKRDPAQSMEKHQRSYFELRKRLIAEKVLIEQGNKFIFGRDYLFNSPSAAAAVVLGRSANGKDEWRDKQNRTLKLIEEFKLQ